MSKTNLGSLGLQIRFRLNINTWRLSFIVQPKRNHPNYLNREGSISYLHLRKITLATWRMDCMRAIIEEETSWKTTIQMI